MLCADSRFWLAKKPWSIHTYLTFEVIIVRKKRNERHWWLHNDDHGGPIFLPLRWYCGNTVFIQWFRLDKRDKWDFKDAETFLECEWQTLFEHGINSLPLVCWRGYGNLSPHLASQYHACPSRVVLRCCVWINSRIRVSKQGVTNTILWVNLQWCSHCKSWYVLRQMVYLVIRTKMFDCPWFCRIKVFLYITSTRYFCLKFCPFHVAAIPYNRAPNGGTNGYHWVD